MGIPQIRPYQRHKLDHRTITAQPYLRFRPIITFAVACANIQRACDQRYSAKITRSHKSCSCPENSSHNENLHPYCPFQRFFFCAVVKRPRSRQALFDLHFCTRLTMFPSGTMGGPGQISVAARVHKAFFSTPLCELDEYLIFCTFLLFLETVDARYG